MNGNAGADLRRTLFQLRRRRGKYADRAAWLAETARLHAMLRTGSAEVQVFEAIEVKGLTFKQAAATIGFSERHLYRVRQSMIEQLLTARQQAATVEPLPPVERQIELASVLLARGHSAAVLPLVQRALDAPSSPGGVIAALTLRVRSLSEVEDFKGAAATLGEARRYVNGMIEVRARAALRDVVMAHAYVLYRQGLYEKAIGMAERALCGVTAHHRSDPYEKRTVARHLIFLGVMHQEGGSTQQSLKYLQTARDVLETLPHPPAAELSQIEIHTAFSRVAIPGQIPRARVEAREALQRAEWHGLVYETIWANLAIAMIEEVAGESQSGLPHAHAALDLARTAFSGDPLARTLFLTSRVESAAGLHGDSLLRLHEADPHVGKTGLMRGILHVAEARVHRESGYGDGAIAAASRAIETLGAKSQSHYLGIAYIARARAHYCAGSAQMRDDTEAAMFYLERGGSIKDLALALELSYKIFGKRAHLERARELRAAV